MYMPTAQKLNEEHGAPAIGEFPRENAVFETEKVISNRRAKDKDICKAWEKVYESRTL